MALRVPQVFSLPAAKLAHPAASNPTGIPETHVNVGITPSRGDTPLATNRSSCRADVVCRQRLTAGLSLTGDRYARPHPGAAVHCGSRTGGLKETCLVFARSGPIHLGGPDRQTVTPFASEWVPSDLESDEGTDCHCGYRAVMPTGGQRI